MSHWSEIIAQKIIDRRPDKEEYVCAAGISPSGSIHIGNFRDIATSYFVVRALRKLGKKARLLFSWDEFDRMRKVPVNVSAVNGDMEKYIGVPYSDVPNPFSDSPQYKTYAEYFEAEFENSVKEFGIDFDYRHQTEMYRSGVYRDKIIFALKNRKKIFDVIDSHRTQDAAEGERENYYPVSIYCPVCGKDTTKITSFDEENMVATYECACGHTGTFDFKVDTNAKLPWKVDWPMRWMHEGVDFEPGGKDHASLNGSYDTAKDVSEKVFGYPAPIFQGYEFIGIKGTTGKMSGSSGLNMTPETLLKLYEPEIILWLYSKTEPLKAFDFCFDDGILRQYFEFDRQLTAYREGKANEHEAAVMENCLIRGREIKTVPMSLLVQLGSVVDFNVPMLETVFKKIGTPYKYADFEGRLNRAKFWLEKCAPDQVNKLCVRRNFEVYETLTDEEKLEIKALHEYITGGEYTLDELNAKLYAIPKEIFSADLDEKALKARQGEFFKAVYKLLLNKERGPRLYLFLYAVDREKYAPLLDFSTPRQEFENTGLFGESEAVEVVEEKVYGDPDPVEEIKPEITIDVFEQLDLRVCQIVKAQEIRKSHSCLKLTLDDGLLGRVIVSSIKSDYKCDELIGKKIIVVANLAPVRIAGVTSQGMLVAGTNNACGCKVVFVDDMVPVGTKIK